MLLCRFMHQTARFFCNFSRLLAATLIDYQDNIVFIKISINAYDKQRWIVLSCIRT